MYRLAKNHFLFLNDRAKFSDLFIFARNCFICKTSQKKTCKESNAQPFGKPNSNQK